MKMNFLLGGQTKLINRIVNKLDGMDYTIYHDETQMAVENERR